MMENEFMIVFLDCEFTDLLHPELLSLDDRPNWFEPECANLLVTDPTTGFQPADQATLRQMLKERT